MSIFSVYFNNTSRLQLVQGSEPVIEVRIFNRDSGVGANVEQTGITLTIDDNDLPLTSVNSVLAGRGIFEARFTSDYTSALTAGQKNVQISGTLASGKAFVALASNAVTVVPRFWT